MKKTHLAYTIPFIVLVIFQIGCKSIKPIENSTVTQLPSDYGSVNDFSNWSQTNWKQFFTDTNLLELIDVAIKNNADVLVALQRIEIAKANARMHESQMLPNLNANITAAQRKFGLYTMDGAGNITTEMTPGQIVPTHLRDYYLGLQTNWEVDIWGKLRNKKKAAFLRYLSSIEGRNLVITNLIADVGFTYYELLALDNELELIRETIKMQENALELVKIQKLAAVTNQLAVKQFEAHVLNSKAIEFEILQKITATANRINFLVNRFPQAITRNKSSLDNEIPVNPNVGIPSDLLKNRPDIRQAEFELMASKADLKAAKAAFYPSFNITGGIGYQAFNTRFLVTSPESMAYSLLGSLVTPLLNRNEIKAAFNTASALQLEALYNYQKNIISAFTEVYTEISNINELEQYSKLKVEEIAVQSEAYTIALELFKAGRANYVEVLLTQQETLQSKSELIDAKKRKFSAVVNMYKALGGGWR